MARNEAGEIPEVTLPKMIEQATNELQLGPDWAANIAICDRIQHEPGSAQVAVKTIAKRLDFKKPEVQLLALKMLDTCMKNCDMDLQRLVASKEVMKIMTSLATGKKNKANFFQRMGNQKGQDLDANRIKDEVQQQALVLVRAWAEGSTVVPGQVPLFMETYTALQRQGLRFPELNEEDKNIFQSSSGAQPQQRLQMDEYGRPVAPPPPAAEPVPAQVYDPSLPAYGGQPAQAGFGGDGGGYVWQQPAAVQPPPVAASRPLPDAQAVAEQCALFRDILGALESSEDVGENEILNELKTSLEQIATDLQNGIPTVQDEAVLMASLAANDEVETALKAYANKLEGASTAPQNPAFNQEFTAALQQPGASPAVSAAPAPAPPEDDLMDLLGGPISQPAAQPVAPVAVPTAAPLLPPPPTATTPPLGAAPLLPPPPVARAKTPPKTTQTAEMERTPSAEAFEDFFSSRPAAASAPAQAAPAADDEFSAFFQSRT